MDNVLSVKQLNQKLRQVLDDKFPFVWVKGEIINLARPSSGHLYFSLKDGDDLLNCVWFRQSQKEETFDSLTGEVWEDGPKPCIANRLRDGQEIICAGRLSIYAPRGQYQLIVELAQETGVGQLYAAYEALKKKLSGEGLFSSAHKKNLPQHIKKIALITAPTGAVIHDFMRISNSRGLASQIRLYPSLVQGEGAAAMLVKALKKADSDNFADIIVLIRGGGSLQDLWAFNDEELARTIYACKTPVITGIGHEPDISIADYVADKTCATPSHVAQTLWQERTEIVQQLDDREQELTSIILYIFQNYETKLLYLQRNLNLLSPLQNLKLKKEQNNHLALRLKKAVGRYFDSQHIELKHLSRQFKSLQPKIIYEREKLFSLAKELERQFNQTLSNRETFFQQIQGRLYTKIVRDFQQRTKKLDDLCMKLELHNPLMPLDKGYLLAETMTKEGKKAFLRSIKDVNLEEKIFLNFKDGTLETKPEKIYPKDKLTQ